MSHTLRGVLWMSGAVLSFCAMAIAVRELLAQLGIFAILFWRTGIALLIVLAVALPRGAPLATRAIGVHLWRNLFHLGGQWSWVLALGALPLATVFAIEFTGPIFTALLAVTLLGERMNLGRVAMLALGFAGVLLILRPGLAVLPWIAIIGCGSFTAHYCLTRAMRHADASVVVPVDFFRLPLIAVVGALFYAEPFDPLVLGGAAIMFAGIWFSVLREGRR